MPQNALAQRQMAAVVCTLGWTVIFVFVPLCLLCDVDYYQSKSGKPNLKILYTYSRAVKLHIQSVQFLD